MPSKHDLREVIDALYASSPDDFTAERNAAAKRLAAVRQLPCDAGLDGIASLEDCQRSSLCM